MAQTTGSVAYDLRNTDFDPRVITLREYMSLYVVSAQTDGGRALDNWENKILKNPVYQKYLDEPVIKIFDPSEKVGGKSIQAAAELAEKDLPSGGSAATLQSRIRTLEEGVFLKLREIDAGEGTRLAQDYRPLTDTVQKLSTRGAAKTATLQYRTSGIGELIINLEEHVKNFPDDKPIANAILLNLEMGSRPSLPTEIESQHYVVDQSSEATRILGASGADGLLIPAGTTGTKRQAKGDAPNLQPYNAPLSQRAVTILQDQSEYNRTNFGDNRRLPNFFQVEIKTGENAGSLRPVSLEDMNRVLAATSPPGIIQKVGVKGGISPTNKPLTSSDLRKLFINAGEAAGIPKASVAALISRDTAKNTGSHGLYIGNAGEYSSVAVDELNSISRAMWGQYSLESSDEGMRIGRESQGRVLLSTNTLVFGDNTEAKIKVRNYEPFGTGQPLNIKIQVGGFTAPVEQVNEDVETTRQVESKTAGRGEYVIYTDEQIEELKAANLWNADMQKRQDEAVQKEQTATSDDVPPKKSRRRRTAKKVATAAATTAATTAAKAAKAAGFIVPGPDPFELGAGILDEQMSPPGESAADIAVEKGQKFVGDLLGVEARKAEGLSDLFTKEVAAETIGGVGGILADYATFGSVSGEGPFTKSETPSRGRNRARNVRAREYSGPETKAEEGFIPKP